jgi:hypothetical protein
LTKARGIDNSLMMALTKTTSSRIRDENNETATTIKRQSNFFLRNALIFCDKEARSVGSQPFSLCQFAKAVLLHLFLDLKYGS